MEINVLGFIPLLLRGWRVRAVDAAGQYFTAQAVGAAVFLLGPLVAYLGVYSSTATMALLIGLLVKVGAAPVHWWFPLVARKIR